MSNAARRIPGWLVITVLMVGVVCLVCGRNEETVQAGTQPGAGSLQMLSKDGAVTSLCPLKHTEVRGRVSGFIARVTVTQVFENPAKEKIEAVYTFPLPQDAAVDDMTIKVGDRIVRGVIRKKEEARAIYEQAKSTGHVAALLDQERPNIFSQAVANILPGESVSVTISYVEMLHYEDGAYEFVFPMVVGPRYIPGQPIGQQGGGWAPDTNKVPDASKITPPVAVPGTRAGHDISLELAIDAGVPIEDLSSKSHEIEVEHTGAHSAIARLANLDEIPNKDFILKYNVAGGEIDDAILLTPGAKSKGGYFTLILQPPARIADSDVTPKELVFVLDTSGSMSGFPIEKAKELIRHALDDLRPGDTFNLITFAGDTRILFPEPVYPTAQNLEIAKRFLDGRSGGGGTEMMKAIRASLAPSDAQDHVRIVCFATDGYVGNDMDIIGEVQKHPNARVFAFGIGTAVNRFLLDGMARAGRGAVDYVTLAEKADEASKRFYERVHSPLLTDVSVAWNGLPVEDVYPRQIPDLFSGAPIIISGRFTGPAAGTLTIRGNRAGSSYARDVAVDFSKASPEHDALAGFWARQRIDDLMSQDWNGMQNAQPKPEVQQQITQLGLDFHLMTQFTSFVAVEERVVTTDGQPRTVQVPVEMPEGVSYEGVFGNEEKDALKKNGGSVMMSRSPAKLKAPYAVQTSSGVGIGSGAGIGGGIMAASSGKDAPKQIREADSGPEIATVRDGRQQTPSSKLDPALLEALDCSNAGKQDCKLVDKGEVRVVVFLKDASEATLQQLKSAGLVFTNDGKQKRVIGRIAITKLEAFTKIEAVQFVAAVRG
jgi:Ca-activated chloride channel family protein